MATAMEVTTVPLTTAVCVPMLEVAPTGPVSIIAPPSEEPPLVDEPDSENDEDEDEDEEDDDVACSTLLYGALHGLEPLEPGAEPRQRIGTSKCGISKKSWTKAEDAILTDIVQRAGAQRWSNVAAQLPGRAGKQCRERYVLAHSPCRHMQHRALASAWAGHKEACVPLALVRACVAIRSSPPLCAAHVRCDGSAFRRAAGLTTSAPR